MKIKIFNKLKKWFNDEILSKYILEFHPTFLEILNNDKPRFDSITEKTRKEYERIMKILKSPKYQRMFYKVVNHKIGDYDTIKCDNTFFGKIKKFIAKQYLRFFRNDLYTNLLKFKRISEEFCILNNNANKYINITTLDERAERAVVIGVSSRKNSDAHIRMRNISNLRIAEIHKKNNY